MSYSNGEAYAVGGADDADMASACCISSTLAVGGGSGGDGDIVSSSSCYLAYGCVVAAGSINSAANIGTT